jgi:Zn-dependent protease
VKLHILFILVIFRAVAYPIGPLAFSLLYILSIFFSVLLHELGHCYVAQRLGFKVQDILLWPLGGLASITGLERCKPAQEFWIAIAGPLVSFVLGFGILFITASTGIAMHTIVPDLDKGVTWDHFGYLLGVSNVYLGAFNLLPVYPMDGGRVLKSGVSYLFGVRVGAIVAACAAALLGVVLAVWAVTNGSYFLAFMMLIMVWSGVVEVKLILSRPPEHEKNQRLHLADTEE